ncbi:MAG: hypothetical protein ACI3U8_00855 [Candidatus Onthomonas sp.]
MKGDTSLSVFSRYRNEIVSIFRNGDLKGTQLRISACIDRIPIFLPDGKEKLTGDVDDTDIDGVPRLQGKGLVNGTVQLLHPQGKEIFLYLAAVAGFIGWSDAWQDHQSQKKCQYQRGRADPDEVAIASHDRLLLDRKLNKFPAALRKRLSGRDSPSFQSVKMQTARAARDARQRVRAAMFKSFISALPFLGRQWFAASVYIDYRRFGCAEIG